MGLFWRMAGLFTWKWSSLGESQGSFATVQHDRDLWVKIELFLWLSPRDKQLNVIQKELF